MNAERAEPAEPARKKRSGASSANSAGAALIVALALVFLAFHLPYLPRSLEDLDSINFALGVRHFDVSQHQPHPPGYPVFVAIARAVHVAVSDEARALGLVNVLAGAFGVLAIGALYRRMAAAAASPPWVAAATALAVTSPLYWFTAARPLSDMAGLAAAVAVQAATLAAGTSTALAAAAFAAGLTSGIRSQVAWLTLPLVIVTGLRDRGIASFVRSLIAFALGVSVWFVPLVLVTGGPAAYWRALSNQGAEDFGNISMLWTTHDARAAADALYFRFVAPWATAPVAAVMTVLAAIGIVALVRRDRRALAGVAAAFGPYAVFDLLFQETFTGRYALPLVVPTAYLATIALRRLPFQSGLAVALVVAMFDAHVAGTSVAAFARQKAPAFRLLDDMAAAGAAPPVLAMDRRNSLDFRRPIVWADGALPAFERRLAAPPQHEWLEAVQYWNDGGRAPVWFVVDPRRAAIDLVQHGDPVRYRWGLPYPDLVSGARPNEMDWYRVERPEWYVGEGWALTPEAAGVAEADHRGLAYGPIRAWIRRAPGVVMIGGRNLDPTVHTRLRLVLAGELRIVDDVEIPPGPFLIFRGSALGGDRLPDYVVAEATATPATRLAIEQFDAAAGRALVGFGAGWHEPELNPRLGARWRWLSEQGDLQVVPRGRAPLTLHLEGESPRRYFSRGSRLSIRLRGRTVFDRILDDDFSIDVPLGDLASTTTDQPERITLETDQTYVPADRSRRTQDRRHLGLRIFSVTVSAQDRAVSSRPAR